MFYRAVTSRRERLAAARLRDVDYVPGLLGARDKKIFFQIFFCFQTFKNFFPTKSFSPNFFKKNLLKTNLFFKALLRCPKLCCLVIPIEIPLENFFTSRVLMPD